MPGLSVKERVGPLRTVRYSSSTRSHDTLYFSSGALRNGNLLFFFFLQITSYCFSCLKCKLPWGFCSPLYTPSSVALFSAGEIQHFTIFYYVNFQRYTKVKKKCLMNTLAPITSLNNFHYFASFISTITYFPFFSLSILKQISCHST